MRRGGELDDLGQAHNHVKTELDRFRLEHADLVAENQRLGEERGKLSDELNATRAAHTRAEMEKQTVAAEIEEHRAQADRVRASHQAEIERLRAQVDELERLQREISSVLYGLGLRVDVG